MGNLGVNPRLEEDPVSKQTDDGSDYAKDSPQDETTDAPTGKEGVTESDETLPDDQAAFQPESS